MPLYKPSFGHGGGGIVNPSGTHISIKDSDGNVIYENGTPVKGTEGSKWVLPVSKIPAGATFSIDGGPAYTISDPSQRLQYDPTKGGAPTSVGGSGSGGGGGGSSGVPGQFAPGSIGFGSTPAYIGNLFPTAKLSPLAPYNFTDPMAFAKQFGNFNRGEIAKNFNESKDLALNELSTELSSLKGFVPAASALKRNETSIDNQFNQQQRTAQVNSVLPNAAGDLAAQRARATSYASGQVPDSVTGGENALELGIRSASADASRAGGFGATSSVARKSSDLLSTQQSINLSKYGDSLLSSNINQTASLFLAPTEFSNAGSQVSVNPSASASSLINSNLGQIDNLASISASTALGSNVQQNQYRTSQTQANSDLNTNTQNQFALDLFGYQASYANSVAGAAQTNTNTGLELQQQQMYQQIAQEEMALQQEQGTISSITSGLGSLAKFFGGSGGGSSIFSGISSLFGSGGGTGTTFSATDPNGAASSFSDLGIDPNTFSSPGSSTYPISQTLEGNTNSSIVGGDVGTGVGAFFGGPEGAQIGSSVGQQIGPEAENIGSDIVDSVGSVS